MYILLTVSSKSKLSIMKRSLTILFLLSSTIEQTTSSSIVPETCKDGLDAFCKCHKDIAAKHPALCTSIIAQCRKSFCRPLCLRMAWKPTINVRCDLAPEWKECRAFKYQVKQAEKAITAQFQAHVCSDFELGCCGNSTKLLDWVENHVVSVFTCIVECFLSFSISTSSSALLNIQTHYSLYMFSLVFLCFCC